MKPLIARCRAIRGCGDVPSEARVGVTALPDNSTIELNTYKHVERVYRLWQGTPASPNAKKSHKVSV